MSLRMSSASKEQPDCPWMGPRLASRDILMGQICCHPYNLDEQGRLHLQSKTCDEWEVCPVLNKQMHNALR